MEAERKMSSNSGPKRHADRMRVDATGRAFAGSQRQIQTYVNEHPKEMSDAVRSSLSSNSIDIEWVSPIRALRYAEYRDRDFLRVLGLESLWDQLREFWPRGGPCWDALGRTGFADGRRGCVLIEAKSHVNEIEGMLAIL
jgi:hypothetical protein